MEIKQNGNFIIYNKIRISLLSNRLVRVEYNENQKFEDRKTQAVIDRDFPNVNYSTKIKDGYLELNTSGFYLESDGKKPTSSGLMISIKEFPMDFTKDWHYGEKIKTFGGTARTLDNYDGPCKLEPGIFSKSGFSVIDDSNTMIITDSGNYEPREKGIVDFYYFGYGFDYKGGLRDFYKLCGETPLIPRYALGNWWSRYHKYSANEYLTLMNKFKEEGIPLSVSVIDMDWHITQINPKYGSGWTGYTFNPDLFPNPKQFFNELHKRGLVITLNEHPADGIRAFENGYAQFAKEMGIDSKTEETIRFDVTSKAYLNGLQKYILDPLEKLGVDFWWMDWQQGKNTRKEGLDPLWILNESRFKTASKNEKRPMIFSRYGGIGSHRYPIGFSGDTVSTWKSLNFQPYFTATASNIGFGWWSHDIGGHMFGKRDDELSLRWLQLGVFSPIMRLHSTSMEFMGKEPWNYSKDIELAMKSFLKLRHALVPYLYTMNYRNHAEGLPLIEPVYYENAGNLLAYFVKNEYYFGSQILVMPITHKMDEVSKLSKATTWLPPGTYYDFFDNLRYSGNRIIQFCRSLETIPVMVKAGSIIPITEEENVQKNPESFTLKVYAGENGSFKMFEDDGLNQSVFTTFKLDWENKKFSILPVEGNLNVIPKKRNYKIELIGVEGDNNICLREIDSEIGIEIELGDLKLKKNDTMPELRKALNSAQIDFLIKEIVFRILNTEQDNAKAVSQIMALKLRPNLMSRITEILLAE